MPELTKAYDPKQYEDSIYKRWEESGFFNPDNLDGESYSIMMPPPNVTGVLHLGHALENALMDTMARYQRMQGKKVLLLPGTDHAALPTQAKVEKLLMKEGIKNPRQELGREKLVEKIREFAENSKSTILSQIKKMGTSCDWSRLAYTFDEDRNKAVNEMFKRMYDDGLIYRGYRVVNWSAKGQSTCSDDEVIHIERPAKLYTFKYGKDFPITIATTRPETKLGDTAIAVNPNDTRYQKFIGKIYSVDVGAAEPLEIKIIADDAVDMNFGTGALGVTPAHSPVDFQMFEKQKAKADPIGMTAVIGSDGRMTENAGVDYRGLTVEEAREKFVAWLKTNELLEKEEDIVQNVGTSDRFGDVIEAIPMTQWWLDVGKIISGRGKSLKDLMREAVTAGLDNDPNRKVFITPERFGKLYLERVENLRDWCLSRQIWWGHRIPAWFCVGDDACKMECRKPIVQAEKPIQCPHCGSCNLEQDPDTLDTWFSSGSWPFSTLGWPSFAKATAGKPAMIHDLETFYPTGWIQMGYEIVYLWMMRMILMGAYALKEIPFHNVYIHGILRDESGKKFSKSSGNNIDPLDVIEQYGTDALRWSVQSGTAPGNDSKFYEEKVVIARNLVNKLWNIARYVLHAVPEGMYNISDAGLTFFESKNLTLADRWILAQLNETVETVTENIEKYNFSYAGELLRDFTWNDFADWYLEIAKIESAPGAVSAENGVKSEILSYVLTTLLKMWHPFMPFVTEAVWSEMFGKEKMLMVEKWPVSRAGTSEDKAVQKLEAVKNIITRIRAIRAEHGVAPARKITSYIKIDPAKPEAGDWLEEVAPIIRGLARIESLTIAVDLEKPAGTIGFVESGFEVYSDVAVGVDQEKEKARLEKEIASVVPYLAVLEKKLSNPEFIGNAPGAVISAEKKKLNDAAEKLAHLRTELDAIIQ